MTNTTDRFTVSNPRKTAVITGWPHGSKRVAATFTVEQSPRGERVSRVTTGAPKRTTYYRNARIVDGSDGRTHILAFCATYGFISVLSSNMQHEDYSVHMGQDGFNDLLEMVTA